MSRADFFTFTTAITKIVEKKEKKEICSCETEGAVEAVKEEKVLPFSRKLRWLNNMLWGGTALLAFEHVWHGEVTPFFPFLTAAGNAQDAVQMLKEMATAGVGMAVVVTAVWDRRVVYLRNPAVACRERLFLATIRRCWAKSFLLF